MLRCAALLLVVATVAATAGCGRFSRADRNAAPDDMFLQFAAMQARNVVDLSEVATRRGTTEEVRTLARELVADQGNTLARISRLAEQRRVALPTQPDTRHVAHLQRLYDTAPADFDREYLTLMVADHEFILSCYEDRVRIARARAVRTVASDTLPLIRRDLDRVRALADSTLATAP